MTELSLNRFCFLALLVAMPCWTASAAEKPRVFVLTDINNGLNDPEHPNWGGWGGRYERYTPHKEKWHLQKETRPFWADAEDEVMGIDDRRHTDNHATIWRWRESYQNDFAARMDWTIKPYDEANHPPVPRLGHADRLTAKPGDEVHLSAEGSSDPTGDAVLANVGATLPKRDAVDDRIVETVRTGKTTAVADSNIRATLANPNFPERLIDKLVHEVSQGIITDVSQVGGYPEYNGEPYEDSDGDGMSDDWEKQHGLNPEDAADAISDLNGDGYTNIEDFINGLNPSACARKWNAPQTYQDLWSSDPDLRARLERK